MTEEKKPLSAEEFYEKKLKGKTPEEILKTIAGLKRKKARLKRVLESPEGYNAEPHDWQSEADLHNARVYIDRAKQALKDMGSPYVPTEREKEEEKFNYYALYIKKITLSLTPPGKSRTDYVSVFNGGGCWCEQLVVKRVTPEGFSMNYTSKFVPGFLRDIRDMYVCEWRRRYSSSRFGKNAGPGLKWRLAVYLDEDEKPFVSEGNGAFPYNFSSVTDLLEVRPEDLGQ